MPPMTDSHDHEREGLAADLPLLRRMAAPPAQLIERLGRRQFLRFAGGAGAVAFLAACSSSSPSSSPTTTVTSSSTTSAAGSAATTTAATATTTATTATTDATPDAAARAGAEIPDETAGPFPGDGTNGPNALTEAGIVRRDIRTSVGSSSGVAAGIETTVLLTVVEADTGAPLPGAAVYIWHCTQDGEYSMYDISDENFLRGVQTADDDGLVTFTSIFPGCYPGRWPHAHFEVYPSIDDATDGRQAIKTSQLAYPEDACDEAYAVAGYERSVQNLTTTSLDRDSIFRDGYDDQLGAISGSPSDGYRISLVVRV